MIAEVDPTQALARINALRASSSGVAASILATFTQTAPRSPLSLPATPWPLPTILAATWAALTPAEQVTAVREERRRELWMQGTQAGDKIRWTYPAWDVADEYGSPVRDVTLIDDPLTSGLDRAGCTPIPYLEKTSNVNLIAITAGS